jgi:S1-C subfamily serine protease
MAKEKHLIHALDLLTEGAATTDLPESLLPTAEAMHKEAKPWTQGKGIQGVGIGLKTTDGEELEELVLKVYVHKKIPSRTVSNPVPKFVEIPGMPPLPTDVEAIGRIKLESNTRRVRPAIPGFSIGHVNITAGTFGCLVRKKVDKETLYMLSNSHVLADEGTGAKGDSIVQPGIADGGTLPADLIGKLEEWVPFTFTASTYPNLVDAAIAKVKAGDATSAIRLIGVPTGSNFNVRINQQVQKTGRTTDYTIGVIKDVHYRTALRYKRPGGGRGRVGFREQVLCTRYSSGGDSGSAILNMKNEVVGLHFAGSPTSSVFNRIENVLDLLDLELVTGVL